MQAIFETGFDVIYLVTVISMGIIMAIKNNGNAVVKKFGVAAALLGIGDAFHLVPRMYALWTDGLDAHVKALGFGKFVTSITMTIFYIMLYDIWKIYFKVGATKGTNSGVYFLALVRIAVCLHPENGWFIANPPLDYGIIRNIPFLIMGLIIAWLYYREVKKTGDKFFKWMPLAILLSFAFYIPVVLFSGTYPLTGMFMIPKTMVYAWIVFMGWKLYKSQSIETVK